MPSEAQRNIPVFAAENLRWGFGSGIPSTAQLLEYPVRVLGLGVTAIPTLIDDTSAFLIRLRL